MTRGVEMTLDGCTLVVRIPTQFQRRGGRKRMFTLRGDPFERADEEGIGYDAWRIERLFALVPAQAYVAQWLESFKAFPPRQKAATFGIDQVMDKLTSSAGSN